jgi:hypothetical protein
LDLTKLTYRQRNFGLWAGAFLFLFIVYFAAIDKTVDQYKKNKELINKIRQGEGASFNLGEARKRLSSLESYLNAYTLDSLKNQQYIMSELSDLCRDYKVTLKNFPQAVTATESDFIVETNVVETEGSFANQLQLVYALEINRKIGRVSSITYRTHTDKNKKLILSLVIYLQNVKSRVDATKI